MAPRDLKTTMNGLVFHGPGERRWEQRPRPTLLAPTDAIVRITTTTICGTDLHILHGDVPTASPGRILGHEGVGIIEEAGPGVTNFRKGDRVIISCITSCGTCRHCKRGMYSHCRVGGWILGNTIDGTQAEYVRIPHADNSLHALPQGGDEEVFVMLSDILPTGFECGVLYGQIQPGQTVAIIGAGPVGLATLMTAQLYSPSKLIVLDIDDHRLEVARSMGATHVLNSRADNVRGMVYQITESLGVDVAIEAVGIPATFDLCQSILAVGGHLANVGVHGKSVELHLETLWSRNVTITTRLVDTITTPMLLDIVRAGMLNVKALITHRFPLSDAMDAYDTFTHAAKEKALKVILEGPEEVLSSPGRDILV
jgi:alcohol dehydrogenase